MELGGLWEAREFIHLDGPVGMGRLRIGSFLLLECKRNCSSSPHRNLLPLMHVYLDYFRSADTIRELSRFASIQNSTLRLPNDGLFTRGAEAGQA